jgi:hypothetical protein
MRNEWARRAAVAVAGAAVVGWCAPQAVALAGPPTDRVAIDVVKTNGSGCRAHSAVVAVSPDNTAFTVTYSNYLAQVGAGAKKQEAQKDCKLSLRVKVPRDFTYAIGRTDYRGFAQLEPGVTARQTAKYYFNGAGKTSAVEHTFAGPYDDDWQTADEGPSAYEPCGKQRHLNIDTELSVVAGTSDPTKTSMMAMDSTDGTIKSTYQLLWKKCAA